MMIFLCGHNTLRVSFKRVHSSVLSFRHVLPPEMTARGVG